MNTSEFHHKHKNLVKTGIRKGKTIEIRVNPDFDPLIVKVEGSKIATGGRLAIKTIATKIVDENTAE